MDAQLAWESRPLERVRQRRAEIRTSMLMLEGALAAPAEGRVPAWFDQVGESLRQLSADFGEHICVTEGPEGLYTDVLTHAPRLANAVRRLHAEHLDMRASLDALLLDTCGRPPAEDRVDNVRYRASRLLAHLRRHRQRGADLVFDAYHTDIGGEN
jgi:hypothetical protein